MFPHKNRSINPVLLGSCRRFLSSPCFSFTLFILSMSNIVSAQYRQNAHGPASVPPPPKAIIERVGIDQHLGDLLPLDTTFHDETGKTIHLSDCFHGRPVILTLVYFECPMLCTMELNGLTGSLKTLNLNIGKDFDVITVSFDPTETPSLATQKKAGYLRSYGRDGSAANWHFLTGDAESIARLTKAVGFRYYQDPVTRQYAHASAIFVVTPDGHLSKYFYGIEYSPRDLRLSLIEASAGHTGSLADALVLLCYHYDPTKARYGLAIMRILRSAGVMTLVTIGGFIYFSTRRNRHRTHHAGGTS